MKVTLWQIVVAAFALADVTARAQTGWLDKLDESLFLQSANGFFRSDLSGLVDLEGYYIDQRPPGLLFGNDDEFFNPRLSLFLDTRIGPHFYSLVQMRADRGFDPRARSRDVRFDEYLLRYTPFDDARLNLQIGKFATVFGNWVPRHDSWNNPFITAPLPYENVTIVTDQTAPGTPAAFLGRRATPDKKFDWLPVIWGPSYASGVSAFGQYSKYDYAFEVKNASLSSRPSAWDGSKLGWKNPTFSGRLATRPNAAWNIGSSFSHGAYLLPAASPTLPAGRGQGDFAQTTVGTDVSFAWHRWQFWAEAIASRFEVPNVGDADTISYFLEAKRKLGARCFAALRWNQQFFDKVPDGAGGLQRWDQDIWRVEGALGYRFNRHVQGKVQYSYSRQQGAFQQGEQLVAAQLTVRF
jgi:hypothetical protein